MLFGICAVLIDCWVYGALTDISFSKTTCVLIGQSYTCAEHGLPLVCRPPR